MNYIVKIDTEFWRNAPSWLYGAIIMWLLTLVFWAIQEPKLFFTVTFIIALMIFVGMIIKKIVLKMFESGLDNQQ